MPETRGAESTGPRDLRATVLVLIGLCIGLPHLHRALRPPPALPADESMPRLIWLEGGGGRESGLYWLQDPVAAWRHLLASGGQPAPAGAPPSFSDHLLPAYRLSASGPPRAVPLPAQVVPLAMGKIPINRADLAALLTIPGVGRRLAATIITQRARRGGIKDRAALMAIPGIGDKKAAIIEGHISYE